MENTGGQWTSYQYPLIVFCSLKKPKKNTGGEKTDPQVSVLIILLSFAHSTNHTLLCLDILSNFCYLLIFIYILNKNRWLYNKLSTFSVCLDNSNLCYHIHDTLSYLLPINHGRWPLVKMVYYLMTTCNKCRRAGKFSWEKIREISFLSQAHISPSYKQKSL